MDSFLNGILLPNQRKMVYGVLTTLSVLAALVQAYFVTSGTTEPHWVVGLLAAYAVVSASVHRLAKSNITGRPAPDNDLLS